VASAGEGEGKRVLIVVQNLPVPFDRRVWLEATTLAQAGYQVSVICPKAKGFNASFEHLDGVDIYRYHLPVDADGALGFVLEFVWCFIRTAMKAVRVATRGRGFDVVHLCNPPETYWPLAYVCKWFGKRVIFDHHDLSPEMYMAKFDGGNPRVARFLLFLERMTFRVADVVITTNESHKRIAMERGRVVPDDIYIVRSGPDLKRFASYPSDPSWRQGKRYALAYLGEICVQDGVDNLVRAVRILRDDFGRDDFHCVFIGGGPHQPAIKEYADEQGVADVCTFTGRVSDEELCRALSSVDVGVDPDPKNDWSDKSTMNKIIEYMYFGLPVAAFDLTEHRFSAQGAARYAEPNSEQDLARVIAELLDDADARQRLGQLGRDRVHNELAWDYSAPVLLDAYAAALGLHRPAAPSSTLGA